MRDHDELGAVGVAAQELDEAADVGVVERGLDLVEEVERARLREEEREQERDRSERLLAAGEHPEARDLLPRRPELDLHPGLAALLLGLDEPEPALAAREERRGDVLEVLGDRMEGVCEPPLDGLRELVAQVGELLQALLEILPLHLELGEPLLLGLVLLLRERIDLAELDPPLLEPLGARRELVALVSLGRVGGGLLEPAAGVGRLRLDPGQLDLDLRRPLRGLLGAPAELDLGGAELAQRCSQLARAGGARVDAGAERRLEALRRRDGRGERLVEALGAGEHAPEQVGVELPGA